MLHWPLKQNPVRSISSIQQPDDPSFRCTTLVNASIEGTEEVTRQETTLKWPYPFVLATLPPVVSKSTTETICLSPNCPPSSSCLASRCPHWYKLSSLCVGTNRCSLTALSGWYFCLTLTPHLKYCVKKGRRFVHKRHMTTTPSCQCPRLSQILSLCKLNFPEVNWNTFLHKNCSGASASIVKKRAVHIIFPYQVGQFDACNISLILACVKMVLMIYIWSHSLIVRSRQK